MRGRQIQLRGCLPALVALVVVGAILAFAVTTGFALLALAVAAGLVAAVVRKGLSLARREGPKAVAPPKRAADATLDAEWNEPPEGRERPPPKRLE